MLLKSIFKAVTVFPFIIFTSTVYSIDNADNKDDGKLIPQARQFVSEHKGKFNGQNINYQVTAGETYLRDKKGKETASIFTFAYTKSSKKDKS